ncbi:MAG: hypothetical protein PVI30_26780 [Myxococcales bacterium]
MRPPSPWPIVALACLGGVLGGCGEDCRDPDGDGFGPGCEAGPDCARDDATLNTDCEGVADDCREHPFAEGCPCLTGAQRQCYAGQDGTEDVGQCRAGRQRCPTGAWGACESQVVPVRERCNDLDDDCDGTTDEGVLSPCGGCNTRCSGGVWGPGPEPFEAGAGLALTDSGELTLELQPLPPSSSVWVANTGEGTLSRVDAQHAREVARYALAGQAPEHVAVDYRGDAWVLSNDATAGVWLSRVAAEPERCTGGGAGASTSSGPDDVLSVGEDACVVMSIPLGDRGAAPGSLSIDGRAGLERERGGDVWVGLAGAGELLRVDGERGDVLQRVTLEEVSPLDSAFDAWGHLWLIDREGLILRVDPGADAPPPELIEAPLACYTLESIAVDAGGRLWMTGFECESVVRYDPSSDRWDQLSTQGVLTTRGIATLNDGAWVAHTAGSVSRVEGRRLSLRGPFSLDQDGVVPGDSSALSVDADGSLWVVSARGGGNGRGLLSRFDPEQEAVVAGVELGRLPRPRGDLTGGRRLGELVPEASATHVFGGCGPAGELPDAGPAGGRTEWQRLHVAWTAGAGSGVVVEARHADDPSALGDEPFQRLGTLPQDAPPFGVDFPRGGLVEVRLTLSAGGRLGAPRVARVGLEWVCPGPD